MFLEVVLGIAALAFLVSKLCKRAWGLRGPAQHVETLQTIDCQGDAEADSSPAVAGTGDCEEKIDAGLLESESLQSQFGEGLASMMTAAMTSATTSGEVPASHEVPEDDEALQAKMTTAELVQRFVRDSNTIDEFIKNVDDAQLALENMKNHARNLQEAQEAKEAGERHLQAEEEAMKKPAEELEIEDMEILQKRAERMVAEECRAKAFLFRDAGRAQGPLERKVKEGLKRQKTLTLQEALKQHDEAAQRTTQEKQKLDAKIKDLIDAKTMFRRHALDWCSDLCAPEKEALMKSVGELTESDKEALQKMHRRLYEAERLLKEKSKRMIEYLRDDEEALKVLDAREQALMEKPVVDLSASDIQVMVRRAESMIEEKERAIKDPDEPLCTMGGPAKPAEPTSSLRELASTRSPT